MHIAAAPTKPRLPALLAPLPAAAVYLLHLLIYAALRLHLHASRLCTRLLSSAPHKHPSSPPEHVALSGALLPARNRDADDATRAHAGDDDALAALAAHVVTALRAGVHHITLHDAFRDLPVGALLRRIAVTLAASSQTGRVEPQPCVVTELAHDVTRRTQLDLAAATDDAWDAPVVTAPHCGGDGAQLTVVRARAGRAGLARAARKLARDLYCNGDTESGSDAVSSITSSTGSVTSEDGCAGTDGHKSGADLSVEDVCEWLDRDGAGCMLPSEPDVLISFPVAGVGALPVLRDFPVWQLRLTQLVFAEQAVTALGPDEMLRMAASAANAPRRFGR